MQFGVHLYPFYRFPDLKTLVGFIQRAEGLGWSYIAIPEHAAYPVEFERTMGQEWWDPLVLATHLADATRTIRFCYSVLILPQHNPFTLAKAVATLDHISNGRISVGVGVGWNKDEMELWGADFHKRGALTEEYIKVMKALWTTHPSAYQGKFVSFSGVSCYPKPVQQPHPPVFVGGSPRTSAKRAALLGEGWIPMSGTDDEYRQALQTVKDTLKAHGRSLDGFTIAQQLPLFGRNPEAAEHSAMAGGNKEVPLNGDYQRAIEQIKEWEALGVTQMQVAMPPTGYEDMERELENFAQRVIGKV